MPFSVKYGAIVSSRPGIELNLNSSVDRAENNETIEKTMSA
jgi:hypothetical protein